MARITTYGHCAVLNGFAYEGSKQCIVSKLYSYSIKEDRVLRAKFSGYVEREFHSYGDCFSNQEMHKDAVDFLYNRLPMFGVKLYRNIG